MRLAPGVFAILLTSLPVCAQWQMQTSNTTADLRGIDNVGGGVAWASGTHGTVLRTEDGGYVWQTCAVPPGAEKLDFRGVQAFDANTAIVMSSGPGDQSRLYKTTDGCHTWKLVFTNPDKDGFWDAISTPPRSSWSPDQPEANHRITVLGDPTQGMFTLFTVEWNNSKQIHPKIWYGDDKVSPQLHLAGPGSDDLSSTPMDELAKYGPARDPKPLKGEAFFAASNSAFLDVNGEVWAFVTGGSSGARGVVYGCDPTPEYTIHCTHFARRLPLAIGESAGAFSIAAHDRIPTRWLHVRRALVVVGGDYLKPNDASGTAAFSLDDGRIWHASTTPPHGYRSAVAYDSDLKLWITVGPNGTDVSSDDGRNWRAAHPDKALGEADDADRNWNALSLPFVVGPHGRIGKLEPAALGSKGAGTKEQESR